MRKISIKRILLALGGVFAAILLAAGAYLFWGSWVSPFERSAMLSALDRIDDIDSCTGDAGQDYDKRVAGAQTAISLAQRRAFSGYDHQLLSALQLQFDSAKTVCKLRRKASIDSRYANALEVVASGQPETSRMLRSHLQ